MISHKRYGLLVGVCLIFFLAPVAALAKAHLWRFDEIFSNADGSIQFIEMVECCGSSEETNMDTVSMSSDTNTYDFPNDLVGDTAFQWILIATQSFAELPGAPTPDYIMPPHFFDPDGDTLRYRVHDTVAIPPGALPTNGVDSIDRNLVVQKNNPQNFAGESGSVIAHAAVPVLTPVLIGGLCMVLGATGSVVAYRRRHRSA
jgi:hypothetical protein